MPIFRQYTSYAGALAPVKGERAVCLPFDSPLIKIKGVYKKMANRRYLVIGWGYSKDTNEPYSRLAPLITDYKNGSYEFIDMKALQTLDEVVEVGTIIDDLKITRG